MSLSHSAKKYSNLYAQERPLISLGFKQSATRDSDPFAPHRGVGEVRTPGVRVSLAFSGINQFNGFFESQILGLNFFGNRGICLSTFRVKAIRTVENLDGLFLMRMIAKGP